jgi:hypothetical protein
VDQASQLAGPVARATPAPRDTHREEALAEAVAAVIVAMVVAMIREERAEVANQIKTRT